VIAVLAPWDQHLVDHPNGGFLVVYGAGDHQPWDESALLRTVAELKAEPRLLPGSEVVLIADCDDYTGDEPRVVMA
jgi:hypothetical protein